MPVGKSNRVVIEVDVKIKRQLYAQLARDGQTLKDWFRRQVDNYIGASKQQANLPFGEDNESSK